MDDDQLRKDLAFLSNRLYVWLHPVAYHENVIPVPNPHSPRRDVSPAVDTSSVLPYTEKVYSRIPRKLNHQVVILERFPTAKMKLDAKSVTIVGDLVFLPFTHTVQSERIPLFTSPGILTTDIDLIAYAGGGSHQIVRTYETMLDLTMYKTPKHGNYHIESTDHTLFIHITTPDPTWPAPQCWEVRQILIVLHKNRVLSILRELPKPEIAIPENGVGRLHQVSIEVGFYSDFGRFSESRLHGTMNTGPLNNISYSFSQLPQPFGKYVNCSLVVPADINWRSTDFDASVTNLPPPEGFLTLNICGTCFMTSYSSRVTEVSEKETQQRIRAHLELHTIIESFNIRGRMRDVDCREKVKASVDMLLSSKNGSVVLYEFTLVAPMRDVKEWMQITNIVYQAVPETSPDLM